MSNPLQVSVLVLALTLSASAAQAQDKDKPNDSLSQPVTPAQAQNELRERERLNAQQAELAARQNAENEANRLAYEQQMREYNEALARNAAETARWRAQGACNQGNGSNCANKPPNR